MTKTANPIDALKKQSAIHFTAFLFRTKPYTNKMTETTNKNRITEEILTFVTFITPHLVQETSHIPYRNCLVICYVRTIVSTKRKRVSCCF
jgi:hypothetical protein